MGLSLSNKKLFAHKCILCIPSMAVARKLSVLYFGQISSKLIQKKRKKVHKVTLSQKNKTLKLLNFVYCPQPTCVR